MSAYLTLFFLLARPPPQRIKFPRLHSRPAKGQFSEQPDRPGKAGVWQAKAALD